MATNNIVSPVAHLRAAFGANKAVVPFLTADYPDTQTFLHLLDVAADNGCNAIEVGIPFSDPVADGPVIQVSSEAALRNGATLKGILSSLTKWVEQRKKDSKSIPPLVMMGYLNPFKKYGFEALAKDSAKAGVCGLIVPDLPSEEAAELVATLREHGLAWIPLIAPTTSDVRAQKILADADAFAYFVSVAGVTGTRTKLPEGWATPLRRIRKFAKGPLVVGFGIASVETAKEAALEADGIVVGSALVSLIGDRHDAVAKATTLIKELRAAV